MLESLVAGILNRFLGSYVENFDPKQLNIGIWSGDVKLSNLRLKKDSLDKFELPIDVKFGHLGNLTLQIPWSNLKGKPVKVIIEDVYLLAAPIVQENYNFEEEAKRELALKFRKLADLELREKAAPTNDLSAEDAAKNESFTESLINKIVDNLQVEIKKIHVRYEDFNNVFTDNPYSIGITLNELSALSTDKNWTPKFIDNPSSASNKLLTLDSLCAYWNTNSNTIYTDNHDELLEKFKQSIIDDENLSQFEEYTQFILRPVSGYGHLTVNKLGATGTQPHIKTEVFFEEFCVDLDSEQYNYALYSASKLHWYRKTHKFKRFRPKVPIEGNSKEWFKYAANAVLNEIHEKNYRRSWEFLKQRRDNRKAYISLWKEKLQLPDISQNFEDPHKDKEFKRLEEEISYEDIKFFRSLAKNELRKEILTDKVLNRKPEPKPQQQSGWFSSWWRGSDNSNTGEDDPEKIVITDEQRQEFYDAIEFDETQALTEAIDIPRDRVNFEIKAELKRGGFSIKNASKKKRLANFIFEGFAAQHYQRPDSFLSKFTLQEFKVEDNTETSLYKNVVSVEPVDAPNEAASSDPFFFVLFENNPLDNSADSTLIAKLRSLTIFYHVHFVNEIIRFFQPPKAHLETIYAIMNAAEETVEGFTTQTRLGLEAIWEEHKTINAQLDLQAPLIILPLDPHSWSSPCAVIDAGHIGVTSDLADKDKTRAIKNLSVEDYAKISPDELNQMMYDKFNLTLKDTQVLIGPNIRSTIEQLQNKSSRPYRVVDQFEMKILLELSILPYSSNLARIRATANLKRFAAKMNDYQYKIMMQLIDKCIPDFSIESDDSITAEDTAIPFALQSSESSLNIDHLSDEHSDDENGLTPSVIKVSKEKLKEQHQFEFKFNVDKVELLLAKCTDGKTLESDPIVNLIAESLALDFFKTEVDMHLDLTLGTFNIEDLIDKTASKEFKKLISSNNFIDTDNIETKEDIFKLNYQRSQRFVPLDGKEIEVFDQDIDLDLSALKVIVTRKSLLTILNFILTTFTDPNPPETEADVLRHNDASDIETSPGQIRVNLNLDSILLVFNDEGIKLATLQLATAHVNVLVLPEKLKVYTKLGALTLHDEVNEGSSRDSTIRKILSFDGDKLAEFTYETFDISDKSTIYQSRIDFNAGSLRFNFVEEPINKILNFLTKFQKMKDIYDSARDAAFDQVNPENQNMQFNVLIETPIFVFPKLSGYKDDVYDDVTLYLGELKTSNTFIKQDDGFINKIDCGLRSIRATSTFHQYKDEVQSLKIIDDVDLLFDVDIFEQAVDRPKTIVLGQLVNVIANLTEMQFNYLYLLSQSVSSAFIIDDPTLSEIEESALEANKIIAPDATYSAGKEIAAASSSSTLAGDTETVKLDFEFKIPQISLTIHDHTENVKDLATSSVSRFSLNDIGFKFTLKEDSHFKSNFFIGALTAEDLRDSNDSQFTEIIPRISGDEQQIHVTANTEGPAENKVTFFMAKIRSPKLIMSLSYLFALKSFADAGLKQPPNLKTIDESSTQRTDGLSSHQTAIDEVFDDDQAIKTDQSRFGFSLNVIDTSVILLADPTSKGSEAIVFKIEQALVSKQNITSVSINNVGMFLCKMDQFDENRIRIIDDFSSSVTIDERNSTPDSFISNIQISVEPLVMKVSLNDINLAMSVFNNAVELAKQNSIEPTEPNDEDETAYTTFSKEFKKKLSQYAPSITSSLTRSTSNRSKNKETEIVIKAEKLSADIEGFRLVLIGNINELPVLDLSVTPFQVCAKNWSTDLEAETNFQSSANVYNYAKSTWEPFVEPWPLEIHVSRNQEKDSRLNIDFVSKKLAEITVSSRAVALFSKVVSSISGENEIKARGAIKPYKILNETGFDINVWSGTSDNAAKETTIKDGDIIPWEFQDWRKIRENLDINTKENVLNLELIGSGYDRILKVAVDNEGEEIYTLTPAVDGVHNRLIAEIILNEDDVKTVAIRSTINIENFTQVAIVFKGSSKTYTIPPGISRSVPINEAYNTSFSIKPDIKVPFNWSEDLLDWRSLMRSPMSVRCASEDSSDTTSFFFQVEARFDRSEPLAKVYPHMKIIISAPLEIENLLPFDIGYRLYDRTTKRDWRNFVKKSNVSPVHVVELDHFLLLSVHPKDSGFEKSDFAIINSPLDSEFKREKRLCLKHQDGQTLNLNIHYATTKNNGVGLKVVIYSPYIVLNRTGKDIYISENYNVLTSKVDKSLDNLHTTVPRMFSFEKRNDVGSRALVRVGATNWSKPVSFESIGQISEVSVQVPNKRTEMNLGVTVAKGEGKYTLCKVVTFVPRYIARNNYSEGIEILNIGASDSISLSPGQIFPLYNLQKVDQKQIQIRFSGGHPQWSSPFNIKDVGQIYIKALKPNVGHVLLKVDILFEDASLFINISDANDHWPFSIRNFSDQELIFYQINPYLNENDELSEERGKSFKPIYYKVPPKSVMSYAWDYPAGIMKELILRAGGRERHIQLAEIGNLRPMKLPNAGAIIDLNVVADGPTQSLVVSNYDPKSSFYKLNEPKTASSLSVSNSDKFKVVEEDSEIRTQVLFKFQGIGISLINTRLQELCYITGRGVELRFNDSDLYQTASWKLKWLQIDNQLFGGIYPIVMYPTVVPQSLKEMNNHPAFSGSISRVKDNSHGVTYIKYATTLLQEMSLEIDEDFLFALLDFFKFPGAAWNKEIEDKLCDATVSLPELNRPVGDSDIYFEVLHIQPTQLNLSFVRTERINVEDKQTSQNAIAFFLNILTMAIGNINDAPIRMNALLIENVRVPIPTLIQNIQTHYGQNFFYQIHNVLGSADVLGNPVGLFNNVSSGVMDFFYEPYQGLVMNDRPQELGITVAKGGLSFLKKSVFGFSDSFAKFTGSVAKGLTAATLDKDFQDRRRMNQRRNKPKHALYGFRSGASSFFDGITSGITGMALSPMEGASKDGAQGFLKGVGKGLIGLPTKTAIGVFDLANQVSEGIRNTTLAFDGDGLDKVRLPRFVDHDEIIRPYNSRESQGQYWLKTASGGQFINDEYLAHAVLPGEEMVVIVTFSRIILIATGINEVKWSVEFENIRSITQEKTGIKIGLADGGDGKDPFIPIPDVNSRRFLYKKIGVSVNEFNKKCQVVL